MNSAPANAKGELYGVTTCHQHRSSTACISPAIRSRMRRPILATVPSPRRRASAASPWRPMNFAGTPAGIDARKVVDTGILPIINSGIAHRHAGVGQIGAGITQAPLECFTKAVTALASTVPDETP